MVTSTDAENAFDKLQYLFMIKMLSERKQRGFPQPDKVHFQKVYSQHQTYGESLDSF